MSTKYSSVYTPYFFPYYYYILYNKCMKNIIYRTVTIKRNLFQNALSKNMYCFNCHSENKQNNMMRMKCYFLFLN